MAQEKTITVRVLRPFMVNGEATRVGDVLTFGATFGYEMLSARKVEIIDKAVAMLQESYQYTPTQRGAEMTDYLLSAPVLLAGEAADAFAERQGLTMVDPGYFTTQRRVDALRRLQQSAATGQHHPALGNVGAQLGRRLLQRVLDGGHNVVEWIGQCFQNFIGRDREATSPRQDTSRDRRHCRHVKKSRGAVTHDFGREIAQHLVGDC